MTIYPPCKYCGASHGMGIEDMVTGHITPIDLCSSCLWGGLKVNLVQDQITLNEEAEQWSQDLQIH